MERQLHRIRDKKYPERPKSDEAVKIVLKKPEIFEEYGSTLNKEHPFYVDSVVEDSYAFHVFASFAVINLIKKNIEPAQRRYLMDGTFKIVPRQFSQLLIISIEYKQMVCFRYIYIYISIMYINNNLIFH